MEFGAVEALFQENPPRLSHTRLDARIEELRRGGCNQRAAWSKLGCIAIINAERTGVETRHLACNPTNGQWSLSDPYPIANVAKIHEGHRLQHVTWSSHGAELAVVDVLGRVSFYTVFLAINQLTPASVHLYPDDDLNALVGFWWLPAERPYSLHTAVKSGDGSFRYYSQNYRPFGPFHPVPPKAAAIGITRTGTAKLWYHDGQSKYQETTCELETVTAMDELFTHASISWNKESVAVLAAYTNSKQLRVYRLAINWNLPSQQAKQPPQFPTNPVLLIKRVKLIASAFPMESSHEVHLAHLEVLGTTPGPREQQQQPPPGPTILGVFSGKSDDGQPVTVLSRWDLREQPSALHPSFDQLGVRRASISSPVTIELDLFKLDDLIVDKCCIGIWPVTSGTIIAFAFSDGSLDFRDRHHLQAFTSPPTDGKITNMIQAGFTFPGGEPCVDMVLSPNNTVAVRIDQDHGVHLMVTEYNRGPMTGKENIEVACVALAFQHAYSCNNYLNNDDLLLVAKKYKTLEFNNTFLIEVHRALKLKMDFAAESPSDRLIRNALLQRCLSLQYALGYQGERVKKELSGKLAWTTLHLRVASLAFGLTFNPTQRQGRPPGAAADDTKPEALQTLFGLVRWFLDVMCLIVDDLIELSKVTKGRTGDLQFVREKMVESNSPALILALASAPRAFLRYNCRSLRGLENNTARILQNGPIEDEARTTYRSFKVPMDHSSVKIHQFEKMMTDIDGTVRAAYHNISETDRATFERLLFVDNEIPDVFRDPVERLLNITVPALRDTIDVSKLFWHDISWLGLHDDASSRIYHKKHRIDAVRKVVIHPSATRLRRCTRCCSVVEDTTMGKNMGSWLQSMHRMCLCGTLWMHLSPYQ